jgi:ketosteroid isomerase-like protein
VSGVDLVRGFYEAFARRDGDAMAAVYADDATFRDPVFPDLRGAEVGAMWRMLCGRAKDLVVTASGIEGDDARVRAHWEATYTFSATGRKVHNVVDATFDVENGRVVRHVDDFDFWRWSRMALGASGLLLGWSPVVRNKVRAQARAGLDAFMAKARAL